MKDVRHFRNSMKHTIYETKTIFIGDDMYYHYIYKIVNNINNKYYIGVHSCKSLERDKYAGSGYALQEAYTKYGIDNFTKHILQFLIMKRKCMKKSQYL
ncbi:MAG: homing endonuclease [phage Lak_Megaphage_RVC_AP3_GC31]|nr:MAG: homing endonuclease [phage Lak_Megaphage_RVC_AP3_GC31]